MPQVTVYVETALRFLYYLLGCVTDYIVLAFGLYLVRIAIAAQPLSLRQCSHAACCEHAPIASWDAVQCMLPVACCPSRAAHTPYVALRCSRRTTASRSVASSLSAATLARCAIVLRTLGYASTEPPYECAESRCALSLSALSAPERASDVT